jgi:polyisoprenoid-binding protein YceI
MRSNLIVRLGALALLAAGLTLGPPVTTGSVAVPRAAVARYRIDAAQSRFTAHAIRSGLLWFLGKDHLLAVRDFGGDVELTPDVVTPASLEMTVRAESLAETRPVFTDAQKKIIDKEVRELVLQTATYPEIHFKSTSVAVRGTNGATSRVVIAGDLTLHGITRHVEIPADVTFEGDALRARGEFSIDRSDFNVKATTARKGTIRVRDKVEIAFDIVARRAG